MGALVLFVSLCVCPIARSELPPFIRGVDLSFLPQLEAQGVVFRANDEPGDLFDLLASNGVNLVRLRLWHAPADGWNNITNTISMAHRIKDAGMSFLLDIHYSDVWADPGQQLKPAAWAALSYTSLLAEVRGYTENVITQLSAQGVLPDAVQVGNEITAGFLWGEGRIGGGYDTNWTRFAELLKAGITGVTNALGASENVSIILHIDRGGDNAGSRSFFDAIIAHGVPFDIVGLSYYPWWHGSLQNLASNVNDLAARYGKDILVMETAYPWTLDWSDATHNVVGLPSQLEPGFPAEPRGQTEFICAVRNIMAAVPESRGRGFCYWAPDYVAAGGSGSSWENLTLFDFQTNLLSGAQAFEDASSICAPRITEWDVQSATGHLRIANLRPGATATVIRADTVLETQWSFVTNLSATSWAPFVVDPISASGAAGFLRFTYDP